MLYNLIHPATNRITCGCVHDVCIAMPYGIFQYFERMINGCSSWNLFSDFCAIHVDIISNVPHTRFAGRYCSKNFIFLGGFGKWCQDFEVDGR